MPIYEYYCPDNNRIYQFFAKTVAQGQQTPKCPDNPKFRMKRIMSAFAITGGGKAKEEKPAPGGETGTEGGSGEEAEDPRMEAAMDQLEREMEEVVRKLEEGEDPESLEEQFGDAFPDDGMAGEEGAGRGRAPTRDPKLYDYD